MNILCKKCNQSKDKSLFHENHPYCKECLNKDSTFRRRKFKSKCLKYKGSKCERCGYSKCEAALDFHHKDSSNKDFGIGKLRICSFEKNKNIITKELDKCILLCSNCHREEHYNENDLSDFTHSPKQPKVESKCIECNSLITKKNARCVTCSIKLKRANSKCPSSEQLKSDLSEFNSNICAISRKYFVSDNTIRNWLRKYSLL